MLLRFLQGLAACGGVVLARTMVRDLAERDQAARAMSLMMACTSIAPMLAPLIGGQVLWFLGWRAIFWVLAGDRRGGADRRLAPPARDPAAGIPPAAGAVVDPEALRRAVPPPRLHGLRLHQHLQFSALLSFLSGSPFVFIERYGVSPRAYGLIFGGMIVFMTLGSLLNAKFAPVFGAGKILRYAVIVPAIAGSAALVLGLIEARYGTIGMWPFLLCFAPQIATISLIGPNSMAMALQRYPHMAGTASSLMGVMQFGIGAIFGAVVGQTFDGTIAPMTTAMGIAGMLCLLSNRLLVQARLDLIFIVLTARHTGEDTGGPVRRLQARRSLAQASRSLILKRIGARRTDRVACPLRIAAASGGGEE